MGNETRTYQDLKLDEERALYSVRNAKISRCTFEGPADGESALKECRDIVVENCDFHLRYPFWHVERAEISDCRMYEGCRAALWYDEALKIENCSLGGIKALRECSNIEITHSSAVSQEFGWMCRNVKLDDFTLTSEYPFLNCRDMQINDLKMKGKYSFQYVENAVITNSVLDTKDAFWHSKNVTVYDSVIRGEYLAWYSENLRLVRCKIVGTQPLCYCKGLVLEDCEMEGTDLSFENSDVVATIRGGVDSVKNPVNGSISADAIGEIILDEYRYAGADCKIIVAGEQRA